LLRSLAALWAPPAALALAIGACRGDETEPEPAPERIPTYGENALVQGFGVPIFSLETVTDRETGTTTLSWEAPEETVTVRCALFWQQPTFIAEEESSPTGRLRSIVDFDFVTLTSIDSHSMSGGLALDSLTLHRPKKPCEAACSLPECAQRAGAQPKLMFGCWSFSRVDVNGATRLVELMPSEVGGSIYRIGFVRDCAERSEAIEGPFCEIASGGRGVALGRCTEAHQCAPLCNSCEDCVALERALPLGEAHFEACEDIEGPIRTCRAGPDETQCVDAP